MPALDDYNYALPAHNDTCTECGEEADNLLRFWESNAMGAAAVLGPEETLCLDCLSQSTDGEKHPLSRLKQHESIEDFDYDPERNVIVIHTEGRAFGSFDHVFHIENKVTSGTATGQRGVAAATFKTIPSIVSSEMVDADGDTPDTAFGISPYRQEAERILSDLTKQ